jgi:hypothetical protein
MCRPTAPFKEWRPVRGQTVQRTPEHSGNGFAETVPRNLCDLARAVDSSRRRRPWVDRRDAIVPPRTQTREVAWSSAHASLTRGLTRPTRPGCTVRPSPWPPGDRRFVRRVARAPAHLAASATSSDAHLVPKRRAGRPARRTLAKGPRPSTSPPPPSSTGRTNAVTRVPRRHVDEPLSAQLNAERRMRTTLSALHHSRTGAY